MRCTDSWLQNTPKTKQSAPLQHELKDSERTAPDKRTSQAKKKDETGDEPIIRKSHHHADGFGATLEPFYYNKSLTDPIDTARD